MTTSATSIREAASPPAKSTWTITTTAGYTASGYLPPWAEDDPTEAAVLLDRLPLVLADISHRAAFDGQNMRIWTPVSAPDGKPGEEVPVFSGSIDCNPTPKTPSPAFP